MSAISMYKQTDIGAIPRDWVVCELADVASYSQNRVKASNSETAILPNFFLTVKRPSVSKCPSLIFFTSIRTSDFSVFPLYINAWRFAREERKNCP